MPIPGSILGNLLPVGVTAAADVYPSLATLRPISKSRGTTGQWLHTFADSTDPTQVNLACRLSPLIQIRPQDQEKQLADDERAAANSQLNFASYVNVALQTLLTWQVKVDGVVYQIKSVEHDGMSLTTRMMVANVNQFNA